MKKAQFVVSALLLVLSLVSCIPKATPAPAPQAPAPVPASAPAPAPSPIRVATPVKPAWEVEWEKTLAAAKREGTIAVTTILGSVGRMAITDGFRKAYGISVESIGARGPEITEKVMRERRAGLYNYDVRVGGGTDLVNTMKPAGALDPIEPEFILPEITDPEVMKKTWEQGKLNWVDTDHTILAPAPRMAIPMAINTNLVKEGEIKSFRDVLTPKWQGKLLVSDPSASGGGAHWLTLINSVVGWDYIVEVAKTKPFVLRDDRMVIDWLAHGKVAVVLNPSQDGTREFKLAGAPVNGVIPVEGGAVYGGSGNLIVYSRRPHPNAARLFINWFLTKEGQSLVAPAAAGQSGRLDVPTDHLQPEQIRQPGMKYFVTETEQLIMASPALQRRARELFEPLISK